MGDFYMVPVRKQEIEVGKPLPYTIYDAERNLLLREGAVVYSEHQVEMLVSKGMFREHKRHRAHQALDFPDDLVGGEEHHGPRGHIRHIQQRLLQQEQAVVAGHEQAHPHLSRGSQATLDQAKLTPGDALQLQPLLEGATDRYTVKVIGTMKPKSVLVTAPSSEGKLIFVRDGQPFQVRAFSGTNLCAFKSKVLKAQHTPFPYLHLAYPDVVEIMRIRKSVRAQVNLIAAVTEQEGGRQLAAVRIVDLSAGGARVYSAGAFGDKGQTVFISFKVKLDEIEEYINVSAVIRSMNEESDEDGKPAHAVGLQFEGLSQHDRLLIMNLVYQYMLKDND